MAALVTQVRRQRPDLDVRLSFLDLSAPRLADVLATVHADGHRRAVVVPLLLGRAYHARVDVPGAVHRAARRFPGLDIATADVLGGDCDLPDDRLGDVALRRLATVAGPLDDPGLGVVLAAAGSSHAPANATVARTVARWTGRFGWSGGVAAFAAAAEPTVADAVARLRDGGARRVALARWFLAPGLLTDRVEATATHADPDVRVAPVLGSDPGVAEVILDRYRDAAGAPARRAVG